MPADQQEAEAWEPYVPELPTPYLGVIEQHARPVRDLVARAFRAAHGMMLERAEVDPSGNTGRAVAYVSAFTDMAAALKMTMSWASNVLEPLGTASAYLGYGRVMPNLGRTLRDLVTGRLADQVEALIKEPGFRVHIPDWMQGNEIDTLEKFQAVTRKVANVALIPFELSQTIADISIFRAIQEWVRDMRDGRGSVAELPLLRRLGFSREEAEDMLRGYGSEQDYKAAAANALTRITRRGDLPLNRSRSESSKALKYFARFLKFFQAQMANLNQHVKDLREAESLDDARAAWVGLLKFVGANTLASLLTQATVTAIRDGEAGIVRMFGNMMDSPVKTFALTALSSIFGPWKAMVGGGLLGLFGGDDAQRGEAVRDLLVPAVGVTTAVDTLEMLAAVAHRAAGAPLDSRGFAGRYSGMGPVQMIGAYAGRTAPLAGTVLNGLAGVAPNYLGTDTELEQALKTARDFDRRNHVPSTSVTGAREDEPDAETSGAKFRDQMRAVAIRLRQREKPDLAALAHEIRSELPGKDDSAIAASLLARRVLAGSAWSRLSADQQKRKLRVLGPDQTEVLRGHDALLEALSYQFRPVR